MPSPSKSSPNQVEAHPSASILRSGGGMHRDPRSSLGAAVLLSSRGLSVFVSLLLGALKSTLGIHIDRGTLITNRLRA